MNRNIVKMAGFIIVMFFMVIVYMTYIQVFQSAELLTHPQNRRLQILEEQVVRGRIKDSRDRVLAGTKISGNDRKRIYPYGSVTGNITGYVSQKLGRWGLEDTFNEELLGLDSNFAEGSWALNKLDRDKQGNDVILSVDAELQKTAYEMLGDRKGAVVAIEPASGRILVMAGRPGYNPENIEQEWDQLREDPDSPLLNRAAQGLYPPGSTMKIVTVAGILREKPETVNRVFNAPGYIVVEGMRIEDPQARGKMRLAEAFAVSSNYVFATLGLEQGAVRLVKTAHSFGIGENMPLEIATSVSRIPEPELMSKAEVAESAIGQGKILVSPLNMAVVAAAVANGGRAMEPSLVDEVRDPGGYVVRVFNPKPMQNPVSENVAAVIQELMVNAVDKGTGREAALPGIQVAGKTGSAENPHGRAHAWFIGFAPADDPRVAVAVIVENGGAGGAQAAPIAREIMKKVIRQ